MTSQNHTEEQLQKLTADGDVALSQGDFTSGFESYDRAIRLRAATVVPTILPDEAEYQFAEVGSLMLRRGLSLLGSGRYLESFCDLSMAATLGPNIVFPLCIISSVRATCELPEIHDPKLAHVLVNSAIWYAQTREQKSLANLTRGLVHSSLGDWEEALACLLEIPECHRNSLGDFASYLDSVLSRKQIRRTIDDFAVRIQGLFSNVEVLDEFILNSNDSEITTQSDAYGEQGQ